MNDIPHSVLIVGAGIGGLAAAVCLAQRGARVTVIERADEITEVGAGLQISPNGVAVLQAMGLRGEIERRSTQIGNVELSDGYTGNKLLSLDLTRGRFHGRPYCAVHRADLIDLLKIAARAHGASIRLGAEVVSAQGGPKPTVTLTTGETLAADVVIGADGVRSKLRDALPGQRQAVFSGQVAWRATVPLPDWARRTSQIHLLPGRHIVTYPLERRKLLNIVAVEETAEWSAEGWHHEGDPEGLWSRFNDAGGWVAAILPEIRETHYWGLFKHPVPDTWSEGALGLLGDAVHPTLPFLAQGANMALEDAWVLADALTYERDPTLALVNYAAARRGRVRRIVAASTRNAFVYHLSGALRGVTHLGMRIAGQIAPGAALSRFDWLYGYDVTSAPSITRAEAAQGALAPGVADTGD